MRPAVLRSWCIEFGSIHRAKSSEDTRPAAALKDRRRFGDPHEFPCDKRATDWSVIDLMIATQSRRRWDSKLRIQFHYRRVYFQWHFACGTFLKCGKKLFLVAF
jgi:hypothetical protein